MSRVIVQPQAERDVDEIAETIAQDNFDAAIRFYAAVRNTYRLLADHPNIGTQRSATDPQLTGLRSFGVRGFRNYLVFFIPRPDAVYVIRVRHAARDHDSWLAGRSP